MPFRSYLDDLFDLIAPRTCVACGDAHPTFPRTPRGVLCSLCALALEPADDPPPGIVVPFAMGGPLAHAIHRAKYGESPLVARRLGGLLVAGLGASLPSVDVVVPAPLHRGRLAARGFNQAVELARALRMPLAPSAIRRVRDTPSQVGLGRAQREANVRSAFAPSRARVLDGLRVLVVDDVVTTGATLTEVANAVRAAGAREVRLVALARAPLEWT